LLKTGFFRQVRELKIQGKNPGSALRFFSKTQVNPTSLKKLDPWSKPNIKESKVKGKNSIKIASYHKPLLKVTPYTLNGQ
jgi:hypothetical protein